ncbi:hypothetical protein EVA_13116 [gut metagenome]|uniref:Uncharacterized protein n=1 Tax=gut metagenome TaxID=749906 RepID=J9GAJ0_9ZZZZ
MLCVVLLCRMSRLVEIAYGLLNCLTALWNKNPMNQPCLCYMLSI